MIVQELVAKLGLEVDESGFNLAESLMGLARGGLAAVGAAAVAAAGALVVAITKTATYADGIEKAAQRTGIGVEALQALQYAAERADVGAEGLQAALNFMAKRGVKDFEAELRRAADELAAMPDGGAKAARAMHLFGKQGAALIPMLNQGSAGLDEMTAFARDAGIVLGEDMVGEGASLKDALEELQGFIRGLAFTIAGPLLKPMREWLKAAGAWVGANRTIIGQRLERFFALVGNSLGTLFRLAEPVVDIIWRADDAIWGLLETAGPLRAFFLGFADVILAPFMVLEELWGWITGKRSTLLEDELGTFEDFKKSFDVINPEDNGFVVVAKLTAQQLEAAYRWAVGLKDLLSGKWTKDARESALNSLKHVPGPVGWYFRIGKYLEEDQQAAELERAGAAIPARGGPNSSPAPFIMSPMLPVAPGGQSGASLVLNGGVTVNAQPGQDGKALAYDLVGELDRMFSGKLVEALPAVKGQ